jgi:hypothetical protein
MVLWVLPPLVVAAVLVCIVEGGSIMTTTAGSSSSSSSSSSTDVGGGGGRLITIDVQKRFGTVTFESVGLAMDAAASALVAGDSATVLFAAGTHSVEMRGPLFNLSRLVAPVGGRLTIAGAGMLATTLNVTTHGYDVMLSHTGTERLTVRDLTFARPAPTTTQARLLAVGEQSVTLQIEPGFPQPDELLVDRIPRLSPEQGLFLKRYRRTPNDGVHIVANASCLLSPQDCPWPSPLNEQVHFLCGGDGETCPNITRQHGTIWHLRIGSSTFDRNPAELRRWRSDIGRTDALVGVKVKHGGQAFSIRNSRDIEWNSVRWLEHSRGIMQNCDDVVLRHTRVEHDPRRAATEALSTPGGGPQINTCNQLTVFNHTSVSTGDDSLGLFHIEAGSVNGCHIRDSFARGILLCNVSDAFAQSVIDGGNVMVRNPILRVQQGC